MKRFVILILLLLSTASYAVAEPMAEADIPVRYTKLQYAYDVKADGSYIETQTLSVIILKENALEWGKKAYVTFSTSVAKGEVLEAYTLKKSGQRIDVPKNSYQVTVNDGYKNASPLYSDETTISVLFPDLAVGDSIAFSSRVTNSEGMFPNHFSVARFFSRFTAYDDVSVEITAPAGMDLKYQSFHLAEQKPAMKDGKQTLRWTYRNKTPEKWTPSDNGITIVGDDPSLYVSTFKSYREIAEAYGARAVPKAVVTDRVKQLASTIVAGKDTPQAQAHAIYDWVAKNITYGGNCIGIGAVVPRDLNVILDNKMGDCKDHATLLQALLASRDIESEQALINAGALYQLPDVPVVSAVNHVINYLPAMNLFLDSTSSDMPYAMLSPTLSEKPVLLVAHYRDGTKTPSTAQYGHAQTVRTHIRIKPDGAASGDMEVTLKGLPAIAIRSYMRAMPDGQEDTMVRAMLESGGVHGSGTLKKDDPALLLDTYKFSLTFNLEDYVTIGTATGIQIKPIISTLFPISAFLQQAYETAPKKPHNCSGGVSIEEYVLEFPESLKIVAVPKDFELANAKIDYKATYRRTANTLTVRRELKDKTPTNICSPEHAAEYKIALLGIAKDVKSQILLSD